jgi:hypothetical protein
MLASDPAFVAATKPPNPTAKLKDLDSGRTALQVATNYSQTEIARLLIAAGADVNSTPILRSTPLQFAIGPGGPPRSLELVSLLIASGATVPKTILLTAIDWWPDPLPVVGSPFDQNGAPKRRRYCRKAAVPQPGRPDHR